MKTITSVNTAVGTLAVLLAFFAVTNFASADHSEAENETESHATTVHHDDEASVTVVPVSITSVGTDRSAKIQQLIAAMQQLVVLLQHQLEHMEGEDSEEDEEHDEASHDDHE